jgi:hypothetical protein
LEDGDFLENVDMDHVEIRTKNSNDQIPKPNKETDNEYYYIKTFGLGCSIDDIVAELIEDDRFSDYEKTYIFMPCLERGILCRQRK